MNTFFTSSKRNLVVGLLLISTGLACGIDFGNSNQQNPAPVVVTVVVTAPPPEMPAQAQATAVPQEPIPTPTTVGVQNPTGIVPAEMPILADGLQLTVKKSLNFRDGVTGISMILINTTGDQKIVRYTLASFKLTDDLGNEYQPDLTSSQQDEFYEGRQRSLEPGAVIEIKSEHPNSWAFDDSISGKGNIYFPYFKGAISPQAKSLIVEINNFGPFPPIKVGINL